MDIDPASAEVRTVRTTCPYCGVGCGVLAIADGKGGLRVKGDPAHPANYGRLCSKGSALGETVGLEGRLLHPMSRTRTGAYERIGWDDALDRVADGFSRISRQHGPDALGFYVSGQLLTEDYYVANKLMKGYLGSANIDTNSRLCMASSVAGHRRAFGSDTVPGCYEDLDDADLIVLVGSNAAWCHPVLYQRILANRAKRGTKLVVIDPRRTASADEADLHLPIASGMDTLLFSGLLVHLAERGAVDANFVERHTNDFSSALDQARTLAPSLTCIAAEMKIDSGALAAFYALWARTPKVVTAWSQGVNQSAQGTDKVNSIINCHLATGRIGKPGAGPLSLTGQPNAMGGREVGGLANMLAAHMGFTPEEIDRVGRFWKAPNMAGREGLKAVAMMDAVAAQRIRALWVMATNPAVTLPRAGHVRSALGKLDLLVVSEAVLSNDTINSGAHLLLPAASWGEKDGTVTNSERRISRQRAVLPAPGEARPDWWIICEVAKRLGFAEAFSFDGPDEIFREHALLSAFENDGARDFDIAGLSELDRKAYDDLPPIQWPVTKTTADKDGNSRRLFSAGNFFHHDQKARFIAVEAPVLKVALSHDYPFLLNTGRVRDHWHTMTRTGKSPRLAGHRLTPYVDMAAGDAARLNLADDQFVELRSEHGSAVVKLRISDEQGEGTLFSPFHWSDETASHGRIGALVQSATDPFSGQPELKATPVAVAPVIYATTGFLITRREVALPRGWWWTKAALNGATGYLVATKASGQALRDEALDVLGEPTLEFTDEGLGHFRGALCEGDQIISALFLAPASNLPAWDTLGSLFEKARLTDTDRRYLLSGRGMGDAPSQGPTVCACFGVGLTAIVEAVRSGQAVTVEALGRQLRAGTNCGSCLPELRRIFSEVKPALSERALA